MTGVIPLTVTTLPVRVTVVAPATRVDVGLPPDATVAELVPQLIRLVGVPDQDPAASSGGWLLSRFGRDAFATDRPVSSLNLADGELLYLTPRNQQVPPAVFDDIVDAVAGATGSLAGGWTPVSTRRSGLAGAGVVLTAVAALLGRTQAEPTLLALLAVAAAALLVAGGGVLSRALGDSPAGALIAAAALPYGLLAAWTWAGAAPADGRPLLRLVYGGVAVAVTGVLALIAVGDFAPVFTGLAVTGVVAALAGLGRSLTGADPAAVAAVTAAALLVAWPLIPAAALALSQLRLPMVPATIEEFRTDRPPVGEAEVADRTREAVHQLTALTAAVSAALTACVVVLSTGPGVWPPLLAAALAAVPLLRMRAPLRQRDQRLALLGCGLVGATAVAARVVTGAGIGAAGLLAAVALLVAAGCVAFALRAPGRPASPYWGRLYDVAEFTALAAVFPLAAVVTGLPDYVRGLGG